MHCIVVLSLLAIPWDLLILANHGYLGRTRTALIKYVTQELFHQSPSKLYSDNSLSKRKDLTIVG